MQTDNPVLKARQSLALTQTEMAAELGVNVMTVWRWEKGKMRISPVVERAVEQLLSEKKREGDAA